MDYNQDSRLEGPDAWPIELDLEAGFWPDLAQYLKTELETQYQRTAIRAGNRLLPHGLVSLQLIQDELEARVQDGPDQWLIRLSLPIFDWESGLSLISCACQRESLHLEERRCAHMYLVQKALLDSLLHTMSSEAEPATGGLIEALDQYLAEAPAMPSHDSTGALTQKRLCWVLLPDYGIEVRLQSRLTADRWSSGRRLSWADFFAERQHWQDSDCRLAALIHQDAVGPGKVEYRPDTSSMLKVLKESANLYMEGDSKLAVKFRQENLVIQTELLEQKLKLTPKLGHHPIELVDVDQGFLLSADWEQAFLYYFETDRATARLVQQLLKSDSALPVAEQSALMDYMVRLAQRQLPVALDPQLSQESVAAQEIFIIRFTPFAGGSAKLEILCCLAAGGMSLPPASGPERILHQLPTGEVQTVVRDFFNEQAKTEELISHLGLDSFTWRHPASCILPGSDAILEVMDKARAYPSSQLIIEWPKNDAGLLGKPQLAPPLDQQKIVMRVGEKKDWLAVEGHVELDGERVDLKELMRALQSKRQYVQLTDGRYSRISESLKLRLTELGSALDEEDEKLRLSPAAMEDLARLENLEQVHIASATESWQRLKRGYHLSRQIDESLPPDLLATLRPYQLEGYRWLNRLATWGMGACLADDMGLGKTVQTLAVLLKHQRKGPSLVIAPTSVIANWAHECQRFCPSLEIVDFRSCDRSFQSWRPQPGQLVLVSYGLVLRDQHKLAELDWNLVVIDEAQSIKNAKSQTAKAIQSLKWNWALALSGTPIENHLGDLWSLFRTISPGLLGSWPHFRRAYGFPILGGDEAARTRLKSRIQPFILRRLKKDYLKDLPPKIEVDMRVSLSDEEREVYDALRLSAIAEFEASQNENSALAETSAEESDEQKKRLKILGVLTRMRLAICHPRLVKEDWTFESAKLELLASMLSRLEGQQSQVLIFSQFTRFLGLVREYLEKHAYEKIAYLDGQTAPDERTRMVQGFQSGEYRLFLISLKAGGTGLNLTKADMVIHLDPWWNPAVEDQATDRAYRMGQERQVMVYRLIAERTIEEEILKLHAEKRNLAHGILAQESGRIPAQLSTKELLKLIRHP